MGRDGDVIVTELHGRFYEQTFRGAVFSGGMTGTSINNATFTTATLGATATPIIGLWNPLSNNVNLVVLQLNLQIFLTALTATGPGAFMWCTSVGNSAISTGNNPFNRKTFLASGSNAKDMSGVALTGLTNNLVVRGAAPVAGGSLYNISNIATAAGFATTMQGQAEFTEGAWQIPPGGVLALLCTTTPVAHSAACGIVWEEVPV
jgi:hypothetical protein